MADEPIYSYAAFHNRLHIKGTLVALTALRIGAGRASNVVGNDLPVLRERVFGRPFIPGASLKGALRARAEALIRAVAATGARDFDEMEAFQSQIIARLKEDHDFQGNDRALTEAIWNHSTLIEQCFGATWLAGRIFLKDAQVVEEFWFEQFEVRNGVAINRDTETVDGGKLYDYEVVPAGTRFHFELSIENAEDWQLGMMVLLLKPWERGDVQLGGFRSRGLGHVQLVDTHITYHTIQSVDDVLALLNGAKNKPSDAEVSRWIAAFRDALHTLAASAQGGSHA
ncbi:MAG: CRISPR-associated RAMP protein [Chloroflexaceae bacterium]|nr:CRISPR-associated RAMP protein [Chloroflexaceae bacterium]